MNGEVSAGNKRNGIRAFFEKSSVKWTVLLAVFLLTVAVVFVANDSFNNDFVSYFAMEPLKSNERGTVVRVTFDFGNGTKRAFEGEILEPLAASEALRGAQGAGGFSMDVSLSGDIMEIAGVRSLSSKKWRWYLNGTPEERAVFDVLVKGGDKILVKYE